MNKTRSFNKYKPLLLMLLFIINSMIHNVNAQTLISENKRPILLEVYTSQGCSSCPPAEQWLNTFNLKKHERVLWKKVIPINFHVDYWDYLGWPDPFADSRFTDRQWQYVQHKHAKQVATPGFIVDGKSWHGWFNGKALPLNLVETKDKLMAIITDDNIEIKYQQTKPQQTKPHQTKPHQNEPQQAIQPQLVAHIAILGFNQQTKIKRGENKGALLQHDFVAIAYDKTKLNNKNNTYTNSILIPKTKALFSKKQAIVIWVSKVNDPRPIQVVADWLIPPTEENL